jgi:hypothetical protein
MFTVEISYHDKTRKSAYDGVIRRFMGEGQGEGHEGNRRMMDFAFASEHELDHALDQLENAIGAKLFRKELRVTRGEYRA